MLRIVSRTVLALAIATLTALPLGAQTNDEWTRPFAPFRIVGNIYWVGSYDLSSYLITTPAGNILINTGIGDTAQQIKKNVEQLGFTMSDTKILTATHGHFDHVAGLAELKTMTGARVLIADQTGRCSKPAARPTSRSATHRARSSRRCRWTAPSRKATPSRSAAPR